MRDDRGDQKTEFSPHRIQGYDNVCDEMVDAVYIDGLSSDGEREDRLRVFRKRLALYGPNRFESKLKSALLRTDLADALIPDMEAALDRAEAMGSYYLPSQKLPPLARSVGEGARPTLDRFCVTRPETESRPSPLSNVAEALGYLPGARSCCQLEMLARSPDRAVAEEARAALARLYKNR